jgi:hypothetical protein
MLQRVNGEFGNWGEEMMLKERLRAFYGFWLDPNPSPLVDKELSVVYFVAAVDNLFQGGPVLLERNARQMFTSAHQHSRDVAEWGGTALLAQAILTFRDWSTSWWQQFLPGPSFCLSILRLLLFGWKVR